jgi:Flp pilus assembly protein protease CpaA
MEPWMFVTALVVLVAAAVVMVVVYLGRRAKQRAGTPRADHQEHEAANRSTR